MHGAGLEFCCVYVCVFSLQIWRCEITGNDASKSVHRRKKQKKQKTKQNHTRKTWLFTHHATYRPIGLILPRTVNIDGAKLSEFRPNPPEHAKCNELMQLPKMHTKLHINMHA